MPNETSPASSAGLCRGDDGYQGAELAFVAKQIAKSGVRVITVDVGTQSDPFCQPDVSRDVVAACHPKVRRPS